MDAFVLFIFHTGHTRMEQITRKRPAAQIVQELQARFGNQGYVKYAADVSEHVGSVYVDEVTYRRTRRFM